MVKWLKVNTMFFLIILKLPLNKLVLKKKKFLQLFHYRLESCSFHLSFVTVKLVKDEATKRSKGYAFIQYTCQDDAILALENMDCKVLPCHITLVFQEISNLQNHWSYLFFRRYLMAG